MAKKPLEWYNGFPVCDKCCDYMMQPFFYEAAASVGIEKGKSADQLIREVIVHYHEEGHTRAKAPTS